MFFSFIIPTATEFWCSSGGHFKMILEQPNAKWVLNLRKAMLEYKTISLNPYRNFRVLV